jgi:hypothetical protein
MGAWNGREAVGSEFLEKASDWTNLSHSPPTPPIVERGTHPRIALSERMPQMQN